MKAIVYFHFHFRRVLVKNDWPVDDCSDLRITFNYITKGDDWLIEKASIWPIVANTFELDDCVIEVSSAYKVNYGIDFGPPLHVEEQPLVEIHALIVKLALELNAGNLLVVVILGAARFVLFARCRFGLSQIRILSGYGLFQEIQCSFSKASKIH